MVLAATGAALLLEDRAWPDGGRALLAVRAALGLVAVVALALAVLNPEGATNRALLGVAIAALLPLLYLAGQRTVLALRGALCVAAVAAPVAWVLNLPWALFRVALHPEQLLAFELGVVLALIFLMWDGRRRRTDQPKPYDLVFGALGFLTCCYVAARYPAILNTFGLSSPAALEKIAISGILIALSVEGVRRALGLALAIVVLVFLAFAFWGYLLPWDFAPQEQRWERVLVYQGLDTNALFGAALKIGTIVIIPFVLLGKMLGVAGGSDFFANLAMSGMGRFRGGAGKISVVGSSLFGMVSGSAVANVAGVGVVTIPLMKRSGFKAHIAGGIEAVGSTGGQLMPPVMGAAAFLMADLLQVSYTQVMVSAIIPILLYYVAIFLLVDLYAGRRGISGIPKREIPPLWPEIKQGWHFILPFVVFIVGMLSFDMQPETASLYAVATLLITVTIFGYHGRRLTPRMMWRALIEAGESAVEIVIVTAVAGIVIGVLNFTGSVFTIGSDLTELAGGSILVLLIIAGIASIVLGMGMPTVSVYLLLAFLIAPALVSNGVEPIAAHMFVQYFGLMSMVTPPVAVASFAAATIARASPWSTSWAAIGFGWTAYIVPFLFVFAPAMLFIHPGDLLPGIGLGVTTLIGVAFVSFAAMGFARVAIGPVMRLWCFAAGVALMIPEGTFPGSTVVVIAGAVAAVLAAIKMFIIDRRHDRTAERPTRVTPPAEAGLDGITGVADR